jgi:hypothetical protein
MAAADSMMAVLDSRHHRAVIGLWAASRVLMVWIPASNKALMTSPNPSPPSVMGSRQLESCGRTVRQPQAMALAAARAVSVSLNLSGTMSTFNCRMMAVYFKKAITGRFGSATRFASVCGNSIRAYHF